MTPETKEEILTRLKEVNKIPNINKGGCGVVAYHLYKLMEEHQLSPKIVYCYDTFNTAFDPNAFTNEVHTASHIVVEAEGTYWDSEGEFSKDDFYSLNEWIDDTHVVSINLLEKALDIGNWNTRFKREKYIPKVQNLLSISNKGMKQTYKPKTKTTSVTTEIDVEIDEAQIILEEELGFLKAAAKEASLEHDMGGTSIFY